MCYPTDTNPKNLELASPQSVTATRLCQLVYSRSVTFRFSLNFSRSGPRTSTLRSLTRYRVPKRHSPHEVWMLKTSVQIVSTQYLPLFVCDGLLCCLCLVLLLRFVWVSEWCISSQVCIVAVLSVCISDEPSVCGYIWLRFVACLCMSSGQDLTWRPPLLWGAEQARRQGATAGAPKKRNRAPISGGRDCVDTICAVVCSNPTSCGLCLLGTVVCHDHRTPYAYSPAVDGSVLIVAVRECIIASGSVSAPRPLLRVAGLSVLCCCLGAECPNLSQCSSSGGFPSCLRRV